MFFLNIAGEYEIWLQVTNSCGDMVTVPVTLEMVDYRQQTERTNLTEKRQKKQGRKRRKEQKIGTKAGVSTGWMEWTGHCRIRF